MVKTIDASEHPSTQNHRVRSPIHLPLEEPQAVHLLFCLSIAPRFGPPELNCGPIPSQSGGRAVQRVTPRSLSSFDPIIEQLITRLAGQRGERLDQRGSSVGLMARQARAPPGEDVAGHVGF
ncbi:MAG TPA: hypothetical protein VNE17_12865 [Nitrolancea sp.]|nr:hypothetical protein [Nitrolancea sp.]